MSVELNTRNLTRAKYGMMEREELWEYKYRLIHNKCFHDRGKPAPGYQQMDLMAAIAGYALPATFDWPESKYLQFYRFAPIIGISPLCVAFHPPEDKA